MATPPTLSVIIVSYNTRSMTLECLRALHAGFRGLTAEILVVDNASCDGSAEAIAQEFPSVEVIINSENIGFGPANNVAMRRATGRYFLLLNSDAFPLAGCLSALVRILEEHPRTAVAGPRLINADGSLQRSCWRFPSPLYSWLDSLWITALLAHHPGLDDYRRWPHDAEREVDFAIGACLLVRQEAYKQVGGFDERFFMYQEETDWQWRFKQAGWSVMFTPAGTATHLGGASGKDDAVKINQVFFDSLDQYILKHYGRVGLLFNRAAQVTGAALRVGCWAFFSLLPDRRSHALRELNRQSFLLHRHLRAGLPI